jgi:putative ABC transport system permease protein
VILSDALWRRRFTADHAIVGRSITLDGDPFVVVGVMPKRLENVTAPATELWTLLQADMSDGAAWGHNLRTIGRLRAGIDIAQARSELAAMSPDLVRLAAAADAYFPGGFVVTPLHDEVTRAVRPALLGIFGAVLLVLVIVCVNVTNLLLARGGQRRAEFALRAALGAGRKRLIRQLLTESLVLAAAGGAVGMVVALLGVRALLALSPPGLPRLDAIGVDGTLFALGLGITTVIGLAVGVIPALQAARGDPQQDLQHGTRRTAGGHHRTCSTLVVAEVALALVLLVSSGLLLHSLKRLFGIAPGFDATHLLTMQVQTSGHRFDRDSAASRFFGEALEAVKRVPGVAAAALTSQLPLSGDLDEYGVHFERNAAQQMEAGSTFRYAVSPGYVETIGIPLRRGRPFDEQDRAAAPRVALLSESLARRMFKGVDPIGQRLRIGPTDGPPFTVVGIVGDVRQVSLALGQSDAVYIPTSQWLFPDNVMTLVVRGRGDVAALAPAVRRAIWSVDKGQPIVRVATMDALLAASGGERRFALTVFEAFAFVALLLAATGIYGVLSGGVTERTREIGVRAALGASQAEILDLVLRRGMALTGLGIALGLVAAVIASRALTTLLFSVSRLDPITYAGVVVLLGAVAALASGIPAWRAARIDPVVALRSE